MRGSASHLQLRQQRSTPPPINSYAASPRAAVVQAVHPTRFDPWIDSDSAIGNLHGAGITLRGADRVL